ncbi:MAG TPA: ATP-binding protein, partial [Rhizomicrobium sp.]|nr:ATP-binding protein [Rhizomicrobium sp.]
MTDQNLRFSRLRIEGWRQFDSVDIALHDRLTVLTGSNGAGKSSLLQIFSRHLGFNRQYLATPQLSKEGTYTYLSGAFASFFRKNLFPKRPSSIDVGMITYSDGTETPLELPQNVGVQYNLSIPAQKSIAGMFIDSNSPVSTYQVVNQIPTNLISSAQAYSNYSNEVHQKYVGGHSGFSPIYRMKEALVSMATFGEGNRYVQGNPEVLKAYLGFTEILRKVLPEQIGFLDIAIRAPEVVIVTRSGEFLLDASSGGLITLIDIAWRLYLFSLDHNAFVVTMD